MLPKSTARSGLMGVRAANQCVDSMGTRLERTKHARCAGIPRHGTRATRVTHAEEEI